MFTRSEQAFSATFIQNSAKSVETLHLKRRDQYLGDVEVVSHIVGEQTLLLQIRHSICTVRGYFLSAYWTIISWDIICKDECFDIWQQYSFVILCDAYLHGDFLQEKQ